MAPYSPQNWSGVTPLSPSRLNYMETGIADANETAEEAATAASAATSGLAGKQPTAEKGIANGYAGLNAAGVVSASQLGLGDAVEDYVLTAQGIGETPEWKVVITGGSHPNLAAHDALGLATQEELIAHAALPHGGGGGGSDQTIYAADFGVAGDNASDSTTELQAAVDWFGTTATARGGVLQLPKGTIVISSTILIEKKALQVVGYGWGPTGSSSGTNIKWAGSAGVPMFRLRQAMGTTFSDLRIMGSKTSTPSAGIDLNVNNLTQNQPNTFFTFDRVWFGPFTGYDEGDLPGSANYLTTGISTSTLNNSMADNLQNDMTRIGGCVFFKCGTGYKAFNSPTPGNTQAVLNKLQSCFFYHCDTGVDSVAQTMLDNVYFAFSSTTDLHIREDRFTCLNYTSEYAARMAIIENNGELIVHTGYFQIGTATHADGKIILAVNDTRTLIDLSFFDFRENADYATSHPGVPAKISIKALSTGTLAHKNLGLHHVNWGVGGLRQNISAAKLDINPGMAGSGLDDLLIYGEAQGAPDVSGSGITQDIYNYLHWKNPTADFTRNDRIVPVRVKAGIPADGDYLSAPPNGTQVADSSNNRLYVRVGGTWKYAGLT